MDRLMPTLGRALKEIYWPNNRKGISCLILTALCTFDCELVSRIVYNRDLAGYEALKENKVFIEKPESKNYHFMHLPFNFNK